jgi:hypothetical protein
MRWQDIRPDVSRCSIPKISHERHRSPLSWRHTGRERSFRAAADSTVHWRCETRRTPDPFGCSVVPGSCPLPGWSKRSTPSMASTSPPTLATPPTPKFSSSPATTPMPRTPSPTRSRSSGSPPSTSVRSASAAGSCSSASPLGLPGVFNGANEPDWHPHCGLAQKCDLCRPSLTTWGVLHSSAYSAFHRG